MKGMAFVLSLSMLLTVLWVIPGDGAADPYAPPFATVYSVDWESATDASPAWTRSETTTGGGTITESARGAGDIWRIDLTAPNADPVPASADVLYYRTETMDMTEGITIDVRANMTEETNPGGPVAFAWCRSGVFDYTISSGKGYWLEWADETTLNVSMTNGVSVTVLDTISVEDRFIDTRLTIQNISGQGQVRVWVDGVLKTDTSAYVEVNAGRIEFWCSAFGAVQASGTATLTWDLDYIAYAFTDDIRSNQDFQDEIDDLQDDIDQLRKDLEAARQSDGSGSRLSFGSLPHVPTRIWGTKGGEAGQDVDADADPTYTVSYRTLGNGTGDSISLYLPYPSGESDATFLKDDLYLGGSWTELWINDTVPAQLYDFTTFVSYVNLAQGGNGNDNLTVEASGGSGVRADRLTEMLLRRAFTWTEDAVTGRFTYSPVITADTAFGWTEVLVTVPFRAGDTVDEGSVSVVDVSTGATLVPGTNYIVTAGTVQLEWDSIAASNSQQVTVSYSASGKVSTEEVVIITDGDIGTDSTYSAAPFKANIVINPTTTEVFKGNVKVKFELTGTYQRETPAPRSFKVFVNSVLWREWTWEQSVMLLTIFDVSMAAGSNNLIELWWDWADWASDATAIASEYIVAIAAGGILAVVAGMVMLNRKTDQRKWGRRGFGAVAVGIGMVILAVVLAVLV